MPSHQKGRSGSADVTRPASVIERDANPAPLQSLAAGTKGRGRRGTVTGARGGKPQAAAAEKKGTHAGLESGLTAGRRAALSSSRATPTGLRVPIRPPNPLNPPLPIPPPRLRPGGPKPLRGLCGGRPLREVLTSSSCSPSGGAAARLHDGDAVPRRGRRLSRRL